MTSALFAGRFGNGGFGFWGAIACVKVSGSGTVLLDSAGLRSCLINLAW